MSRKGRRSVLRSRGNAAFCAGLTMADPCPGVAQEGAGHAQLQQDVLGHGVRHVQGATRSCAGLKQDMAQRGAVNLQG
eukprot:7416780-Alexandrium_andersonii.AAC.1